MTVLTRHFEYEGCERRCGLAVNLAGKFDKLCISDIRTVYIPCVVRQGRLRGEECVQV